MKPFEKVAGWLGYFKGARFADIVRSQGAFIDPTYGADQPANFAKNVTAYKNEVWVYACVYLIATTIAGLPWRLYKKSIKDGSVVKTDVDDATVRALFEKPNHNDANSTWFSMIEWLVANLELLGNAFLLLDEIPNNSTKPQSLQLLLTKNMTVVPGVEKGVLVDKYVFSSTDGKTHNFSIDEVVHFKYMSPDNLLYGQGSLCPARWSIDSIKEAQKSNLNIFLNGMKIDAFFETEQRLKDDVFKRFAEQQKQKHQGSANSHKTGVLEQGLKYHAVVGNMAEMEYINGIKLSREDICAVHGVPPMLVGILDNASYSNYENAIKIFMVFSILPKLARLEQVITSIVKRFDPNLYFEFDVSNIDALKADEKLRSEIAKNYFSIGIPTNDIIDKLKLPFRDVDGGNVGFLPFSLMPISQAAEGRPDPVAPGSSDSDDDDNSDGDDKSKLLYTEDHKTALAKQFDRQLTAIEKRYQNAISVYFTGLEMDILVKLRRGKSYQKAPRVETIIFNEKEEALKWSKQSGKFHKVAFSENAKREFANLGLSGVFNLQNPAAVKFLEKYSTTMAQQVLGSNFKDVKNVLQAGFEEGLGIDEIARNIKGVYRPYKDAGYKATRMAQTEILASSNEGAVQSYEQAALQGVKVKKGWLPSFVNTRDTHIVAGSVYNEAGAIDVRADFIVGGSPGNAPGLINDPAESINCHCTTFPVVEK